MTRPPRWITKSYVYRGPTLWVQVPDVSLHG